MHLHPLEELTKSMGVKTKRRKLAASYDAVKNTPENRKHWVNADDKSPVWANTPYVRQKLRMRAGYERDNNCYCSGMISTLATDTMGYTAPRPQVQSQDSTFNQYVEAKWEEWSNHLYVNLPEKLRILDEGKRVEGENFLVLTHDEEVKFQTGVALGLTNLASSHVCDPMLTQSRVENGIYSDDGVLISTKTSRPVGYKVSSLTDEILYNGVKFSKDSGVIPSRYCLHWYAPRKAHQFRGVSEITPALGLFAQLRRYDLATLTAAETAAMLAGVMKTNSPAVEPQQVDAWQEIDLQRGTLISLPDGWDATQFKPEHPVTMYEMFVNCVLRQIGRCLDLPFGVVAGDSSKYNYSSARLDYTGYDERLKYDRMQLVIRILNCIWREWILELARVDRYVGNFFAKQAVPVKWQFNKRPSIDPEKDARTATEKINNGTSNLAIECARDGLNWEEVAEQRSRELEKIKKLGLTNVPSSDIMKSSVEGNTGKETDDEDIEEIETAGV